MPKLGMEPIRRAALVDATIAEVGQAGSLDVTVGQIARRAGMSSGLAHHYFGGKDQIFAAAMGHILSMYGGAVRGALARAKTPRARLDGIIRASFDGDSFRPEVISAWLNFYVQAQTSPDARRLLHIYQARLRSNLLHDLRPLLGVGAPDAAENLASLIDGHYLRAALGNDPDAAEKAADQLSAALDSMLGAAR